MIVRPRPSPFALLFILRGSIVPVIAPRVLAVSLLSAAVVAQHRMAPDYLRDVSAAPFTLFGVALSIFLSFRNSACYDRWWEGRRQWGQLVAEARSLARELRALLPEDPALGRRCAHRVVAFAHALRAQLRQTEDTAGDWLPPAEWARVARGRNHADLVLLALADDLAALLRRGALSELRYRILSERMQAMTTIQTACERLRATPTPFTYTLLLHRTAWLFCLLLPFGLVSTVGLATPLLTAVLAYAFFGLDALGEELEEPFGTAANALPLDALVRLIEIAVGEALGDAELPAALRPVGFVLT